VAASGTAVIVGRQAGRIVFTRTIAVARQAGPGSTRIVVRIADKGLFSPGLVMWTVSLSVAGDRDGPGGDVASATTLFVWGKADESDERDEREGVFRSR
jgi:hypothetical protein